MINWNEQLKKSQRIYGEQAGIERTVRRVGEYLCSFSLRREFGETHEQYFERNPADLADYHNAESFLAEFGR